MTDSNAKNSKSHLTLPQVPPQTRDGSIASLLEQLEHHGFVHNWKVQDRHLVSDRVTERYRPESLSILAVYRFEGITDPQDEQIIYALEAQDGTRGILIDAYGAYADPSIAEFVRSLNDGRETSNIHAQVPASKVVKIERT